MRKYHRLTVGERYQIDILKRSGMSVRRMAHTLNRNPSTISRELSRNVEKCPGYFPGKAEKRALRRRKNIGPPQRIDAHLGRKVTKLVELQWSPQQIAGRLKLGGIELSHETIYKFIYEDRVVGGELYKNLRRKRRRRRSRQASKNLRNVGKRVNQTWIDDRPAIVEKRKRLGDYERDTVLGKRYEDALLCIVDRASRLTKIARVKRMTGDEVHRQTVRLLKNLPVETITNDNGPEFSNHKKTAKALGAPIFFSHPYCSWQRGTNENTNGLIRQYCPKGIDLKKISNVEIRTIESKLNNRPRKCLGYKTPLEVHRQLIQKVLR